MFDWTWFIPEFYRFKGLLGSDINYFITYILGLAPIVFIQISLEKVSNFTWSSFILLYLNNWCLFGTNIQPYTESPCP